MESRQRHEAELQNRLNSIRVGIWLTVIACVGSIAYALVTFDEPNRQWIILLGVLGIISGPVTATLPLERMIRSERREIFFFSWSAMYIAFIALAAGLDGGSDSPFVLLLVLPFLFAALTYRLRTTAMVGALDVVALVALAIEGSANLMYSGFGIFAFLCVAILGSWEARNQAKRRKALERAAESLRETEATTRKQAAQQHEVADFGRLALSGASIGTLEQRAVELLQRVLRVDLAAVLRQAGREGEDFQTVAQVGLPKEIAEATSIRGTAKSQSGYTIATGAPVVVNDWESEDRFDQSPILKEQGIKSGATVLVSVEGEPWGILGIQSREKRDFGAEDVSFIQAVANILSYAIERSNAEERTLHEALHDPLTGLPNRNLFRDRLEHALAQARRVGEQVAVLFLDLDQFKLVNDSLGHAAGDELLAAVAPRLEQALRPGDTVARFGGDEFAVLAEGIKTERDALRVAERIAEAFTRPVVLRRREHFASASIGISIATGSEDPEALIRDADAALYRAKERGRGGYEIFDEAMRSRVIDAMQTENDLRRALQRRELELHYQPIHSLADGSVEMLEALLRWNHPERGMLFPASFIPVAEESRLIVPIGRWVIEEACRRAGDWQRESPDSPPLGVAINISAPQLADPELPHCVRTSIARADIDPASVRLELTESTLIDEAEAPQAGLEALDAIGVKLVLDDFGTGFSSLGYLKRLPLTAIKLDRGFMETVTEGGEDATIVGAVAQMASALGLEVCAEGVETEEQLIAVRALGCSHAQGFHLAEPAPAESVGSALRESTGGVL